MHPNPAFRKESAESNLRFAAERGFGQLSVNGDAGPLAAHVPFLLEPDQKGAELHLLRSNPIARNATKPVASLLSITGPRRLHLTRLVRRTRSGAHMELRGRAYSGAPCAGGRHGVAPDARSPDGRV